MDENKKRYTLLGKKEIEKSQLEIEVEIPYEEIQKKRAGVVKYFSENLEIPGFRKGFVPENIIVSKFGEMAIIEESAERLIKDLLPDIFINEKIDVITAPSITITKLAENNPVVFKMTATLYPKIELANYKKIAEKISAEKLDDKIKDTEVDEYIQSIRKSLAARKNASEDKKEDKELPSLSPEELKEIGNFESVEDLKNKVKEMLSVEKRKFATEKRRLTIADKIIDESKINLPDILIESELDRMIAQYKEDVNRIGLKAEDYLKKINKTEEDFRKEWRADAEKRAKLNLILPEIARKEKIVATNEEAEAQTKILLEQNNDQKIDPVKTKAYVRHFLTNELVFRFLENGCKNVPQNKTKSEHVHGDNCGCADH